MNRQGTVTKAFEVGQPDNAFVTVFALLPVSAPTGWPAALQTAHLP